MVLFFKYNPQTGLFKLPFLLCFAGMILQKCGQSGNEKLPDKALFSHKWVRSHEEDPADSLNVFRPESYNFPESPGRIAFQFFENGDFIYYDVAPGKKRFPVSGKWNYNQKTDRLFVTVGKSQQSTFIIKIIEVSNNKLKIRKISRKPQDKKSKHDSFTFQEKQ